MAQDPFAKIRGVFNFEQNVTHAMRFDSFELEFELDDEWGDELQ